MMMINDDDVPLNITVTQVVDSMRSELYKDRDVAGSDAIEVAIEKITIEHRGSYEKEIALPHGTRRGAETIGTEITRFFTHFHLWIAASGVSALLLQLKPLLEKWIENRLGRTVRIKV